VVGQAEQATGALGAAAGRVTENPTRGEELLTWLAYLDPGDPGGGGPDPVALVALGLGAAALAVALVVLVLYLLRSQR
jgi:hypothetical protein